MDEEPKNPEEPQVEDEERREYTKVRRPFSKLTTELDPEDLAQKGVQKMILGEVARGRIPIFPVSIGILFVNA